MKIKVCGLTRREDAELATRLGAAHLGCVLAADSPRCTTALHARDVLRDLPGPVLVFRKATVDEVLAAVDEAAVTTVQLHRFNERDAQTLEAGGLTVHRAYNVERGALPETATAGAPLVYDVGAGGSGRPFDWSALAPRAPRNVFVAGGLTPNNVGALCALDPWGIDVSSGVEAAPGIKDPGLLHAFFRVVHEHEEKPK